MVPHGSRAFAKGTEVVLGGPNRNVRKLSWGWGQSTGKEIVLGGTQSKGKEIQLRTSYKTLPLKLAYLLARIIVQEASCFSLSFAGPG